LTLLSDGTENRFSQKTPIFCPHFHKNSVGFNSYKHNRNTDSEFAFFLKKEKILVLSVFLGMKEGDKGTTKSMGNRGGAMGKAKQTNHIQIKRACAAKLQAIQN